MTILSKHTKYLYMLVLSLFLLLSFASFVSPCWADTSKSKTYKSNPLSSESLNLYKSLSLEELEARINAGDKEAKIFLDNCKQYGILIPRQSDKSTGLTTDKSETFYKNLPLGELTQKVDEGDAEAQYVLGYLYDEGEGVEQDFQKAKQYYELAVNQNHPKAQFRLARIYGFPRGVKTDYKKAAYYYTLSAEQGYASAQYNLAICFVRGEGVKQDYATAVHYYTLSANQGDADAQNNLGNMYYHGIGVPTNYKKAFEYFNLSVAQGDIIAQYNLGLMYFFGDYVEKDYQKAIELFKKYAEIGNIKAKFMHILAQIFSFLGI